MPADLLIARCFLVAHNFHENPFVLAEFSRRIERRGGSQTSSSSPAEGISKTDICQAIDQIVPEEFVHAQVNLVDQKKFSFRETSTRGFVREEVGRFSYCFGKVRKYAVQGFDHPQRSNTLDTPWSTGG